MSTRSDIIVQCADGKWRRIYCHWDGYLSHNGRILFDHYTSQAQAERLVAGGDVSILGKSCSKPKGHSFDKPVKGYTVYYGRDRGEKDTAAKVGHSLAAVWPEAGTWTEFTYVWVDGRWLCGDPDEGSQTLIDLGDALTGKAAITPKIKMVGGIILGVHKPHDPSSPATF